LVQSLEVSAIKVKTLTRQIIALADELGFKAVPEYRTPDGTRIDVAILDGEKRLLAIELEASFKWFPQRVLYDVVKAERAGFDSVFIVTSFRGRVRWVDEYASERGITLKIIGEKEAVEEVKNFLRSSCI